MEFKRITKYFSMGSMSEPEGLTIINMDFGVYEDGTEFQITGCPLDNLYKLKEITKEQYEEYEYQMLKSTEKGYLTGGLLNEEGIKARDEYEKSIQDILQQDFVDKNTVEANRLGNRFIKECELGLIATKEELKKVLEIYGIETDEVYDDILFKVQSAGYLNESEYGTKLRSVKRSSKSTITQYVTKPNTPCVIDILANYNRSDDDEYVVVSAGMAVGYAEVGNVALQGNNTIIFTPAKDFTGQAKVNYTLRVQGTRKVKNGSVIVIVKEEEEEEELAVSESPVEN